MMSEMAEIQADLLSLVEERTLLITPCINTMITVNRDKNRCAGGGAAAGHTNGKRQHFNIIQGLGQPVRCQQGCRGK